MLDCTKQFAKLIRGSEATKIHDDNHAIMLVFAFGFNTSTESPVAEKPVTEKFCNWINWKTCNSPGTEKSVTAKPVTAKPETEKPVLCLFSPFAFNTSPEKPVAETPVTENWKPATAVFFDALCLSVFQYLRYINSLNMNMQHGLT